MRWHDFGRSGKMGAAAIAGAALLVAAASLAALPTWADEGSRAVGACDQTTAAAASACTRQVRADIFLAVGICANESDARQRNACFADANQARDEGRSLCNDQTRARTQACRALGQSRYDPRIRTSDFSRSTTIDNPYFPLIPGDVYIYKSKEETTTIRVLDETAAILGIECRTIRDTVTANEDGALVEDTTDYYAQDDRGNVWYFGEATAEFDNGVAVSNEGAWIAGVDGAKPGIIMLADPKPRVTYRQEFALGEAEDMARVEALQVPVQVPAGAFQTLKTLDFTLVEPTAKENKYYAPGVGTVLTVDLVTGERDELVRRTRRR